MSDPELYCTREYLKSYIRIPEENIEKDDLLLNCLQDAMDQVNNILTSVAETIPIPVGDDAFIQVREACKIYAASLWYAKIFQKSAANIEAERFDGKIKSILDTYKANRTSRTMSTAISRDPRKQRLFLPSTINSAVLAGYDEW